MDSLLAKTAGDVILQEERVRLSVTGMTCQISAKSRVRALDVVLSIYSQDALKAAVVLFVGVP